MSHANPSPWNPQRRRYDYQHRYTYLGPLPGSPWDKPAYRAQLPRVSRLLRELHVAAGYPPSTYLAEAINSSSPLVSGVISGRRMPSWQKLSALGTLLAHLAGADVNAIVRALHTAYTTIPTESRDK